MSNDAATGIESSNASVAIPDHAKVVKKMASEIALICEKQIDPLERTRALVAFLNETFIQPELDHSLIELSFHLLNNRESQSYAAELWHAMAQADESLNKADQRLPRLIEPIAVGFKNKDRPLHREPESRRDFSSYAFLIGELGIASYQVNQPWLKQIGEFYAGLVRHEMLKKCSGANGVSLYDEVLNYVSERSRMRLTKLGAENPNEFVEDIAEFFRSKRRYVIQDVMNQNALEKKKVLQKALKGREAAAEDILQAQTPFRSGLELFRDARLFGYRYLKVEKIRISSRIVALFIAVGYVGLSLMEILPSSEILIFLASLLAIVSQPLLSKKTFEAYYPKDVSAKLERQITDLARVFIRMSFEQLNAFLVKQVKEVKDDEVALHMTDFFQYVFAIMPQNKKPLVSQAQYRHALYRLNLNVARRQAGTQVK